MTATPETQVDQTPLQPGAERTRQEVVEKIPEDMEVPAHIERDTGAQATPSVFSQQVQDDQGQQLIQTPQSQQVTIHIPADDVQLQDAAKGDPKNTKTWSGKYWLRMLKKAIKHGWNYVRPGANF